MSLRRASASRRPIVLLLVALGLLATSCGGVADSTNSGRVLADAETTQKSLERAFDLAAAGNPAAGWADVDAAVTDFHKTRESLTNAADFEAAAASFGQATELVLGLLKDGNTEVATEIMHSQVDSTYATLKGLATSAEPSPMDGAGRRALIALTLGGVVGAAVNLRNRYRKNTVAPNVRVELVSTGEEQSSKSLVGGHQPADDPDHTILLPNLIEQAVQSAGHQGVNVSVQCPPVSVLADPLGLQHLFSNIFQSAAAHSAQHVGLAAQVVGDRVEVKLCHDGALAADNPVDNGGNQVPAEVERQLTVARTLLNGADAEVNWSRWRGLSLYTVELHRAPDAVAYQSANLV